MSAPPAPILLVEDSPEDREAAVRALRRCGLDVPVVHCSDGDEALDYLHRRGDRADPATSPRPRLVLLDLNLPGTDGREVLADVKSDDELRSIPVLMLSTSSYETDVEACYDAGANSYIQKPIGPAELAAALENVKQFWFDFAVLPVPEEAG